MAIQSNFPAIKPSLNLDFANTEALDPRITFTRASTATYYNGVTTAKAEENLLLRSQDYSATWTVTNLTPVTGKTAPDTTSTATEFTATAANAVLTQGFTAIAGSYTFSVFLRRVTGSGDIQIAADNGTWTTKVITGTWARYDVTQTVAAGSKTAGVRVVTDTDAIEVWGAQLEQRDAVTSYTPTTTQPITNYIPVLLTAATNAPRFDHNPTTGESLGLLVEEQRTNLILRSEEFDNASWTKAASSITANTIVAPDGVLTGDRFVENSAAAVRSVSQTSTTVASTTYTLSVFAKEVPTSAKRYLRLALNTVASTSLWAAATYDLSLGTVLGTNAAGGGTVTSTSITAVGNGWYRCVLTGDIGSNTDMNVVIGCNPSIGTYTNRGREFYTGDGYSGIYIWGAQLEAGAFPTSYIATVAATVTRSADAASMTGTNFSSWYNQGEGTVFSEFSSFRPADSTTGFAWEASAQDGTNYLAIRTAAGYAPDRIFPAVFVGGAAQFTGETTVGTGYLSMPISTVKNALAYKVDDFANCWNGGSVLIDTSGSLPTPASLALGANRLLNAFLNGHIRRLAYYPLHLTDAQLQALTG